MVPAWKWSLISKLDVCSVTISIHLNMLPFVRTVSMHSILLVFLEQRSVRNSFLSWKWWIVVVLQLRVKACKNLNNDWSIRGFLTPLPLFPELLVAPARLRIPLPWVALDTQLLLPEGILVLEAIWRGSRLVSSLSSHRPLGFLWLEPSSIAFRRLRPELLKVD